MSAVDKFVSRIAEWEDLDFADDVDAALVRGPNPRATVLLFAVTVFFLVALVWSKIAIIDEVTHAEGKVVPSSQVQVIQHLEGGVLQEMLVTNGEQVEAGQILMRVDDTGFSASFGEMRVRYGAFLGRIQRLAAEVEGVELTFTNKLMTDYALVAIAERDLYDARQLELGSQINILEQQETQRRQELAELHVRRTQLQDSYSLIQKEVEITRPLAERGVVSQIEYLQLEQKFSAVNGDLKTAIASVPRAQAAVTEAEQRVEVQTLGFKAEARGQLNEVQAQFDELGEAMSAAGDRVRRTEIRSPVYGIVKDIKIRTIGGVIRSGQDIMEIVPLDDTLLIEAEIRPADIAFLRPDQDAMVKLTAYDYAQYGGLPGKLERISADTIQDEDGNEFYKIMVRTERNYFIRGGETFEIMPGMIASVDVLTGKRSVYDYLMKPLRRGMDRALTEH